MFVWSIVALIQIIFAEDRRPQSLMPLIPPTSFFLTHFLLLIRRRKLAELNLLILMIAIVTVAYLARYNKIDRIQYDNLIVKEPSSPIKQKRILVLDDQPFLFAHNKLATSFYDWNMCQPIFEQPDYYEHLLKVYRSLEGDLPEIIVDPKDLMGPFFYRLPTLKAKYEKSHEGYRLKK
jgi:hypothetical protein